jgi:hypothetical protein
MWDMILLGDVLMYIHGQPSDDRAVVDGGDYLLQKFLRVCEPGNFKMASH